MDDPNRKLPPCGTQIDGLPSCLIMEILARLPTKPLLISRLVCKSWFFLFSDPLFVKLRRARSPTYFLRQQAGETRKLRCINFVGEMAGENFEFEANVTLPDSDFTSANSCNGLLCLENCKSREKIYVCNPILGEYVTIPIGNTETMLWVKSVLGFSSRSNQFKVLQINCPKRSPPCMAEIYTIGNGTQRWKSIGIAPSCPSIVNTFLNGYIHWADVKTHQIVYFDFESEQFGSLPSPPVWRDGRWSEIKRVSMGVLDGCLCIYAFYCRDAALPIEHWIMKEYGVQESWTRVLIKDFRLIQLRAHNATYNPSFISLHDVAKGEQLTVLSRTRY